MEIPASPTRAELVRLSMNSPSATGKAQEEVKNERLSSHFHPNQAIFTQLNDQPFIYLYYIS